MRSLGSADADRNIFADAGHIPYVTPQRAQPHAAQSDEQRFERLFETCFDRVGAYLLARSDRATAADALARTFEIAWRRLPDVPSEPLPWLLAVARRVLAESRRGGRRQDALLERLQQQSAGRLEPDHATAVGDRNALLTALAALTPMQREGLLLIAWDGLSEREAAAALGCSRGALALRLHRARRRLRRELGQQQSQPPSRGRVERPRRSAAAGASPSTEEIACKTK